MPSVRAMSPRAVALIAAALAAGLLALLAILISSRADSALREQAERRVTESAVLGARALEEQTLRYSEAVETAARRLGADDLEGLDGTLSTLSRLEGILSASYYDIDGDLEAILPPAPELVGDNFAFREWFTGVTEVRSPYISTAFRSRIGGEPKVTTAAALVRRDGRPVGIVSATEQGRTQAFVDDFAAAQGVELVVTDQVGTIIGRSGAASNKLISRAEDPLVAAALRGEQSFVDREGRFEAATPIESTGWTVTATVSRDEALAAAGDLRRTVLLIAVPLGLLMLALIGGLYVLQRRSRSVEAMAFQQRQALAVNDGIVQSIVVAKAARAAGHDDLADEAVDRALESGRSIISELLPEEVEPGDLRVPEVGGRR